MSDVDTIRAAIVGLTQREDEEAFAALDALVAENRQLRETVRLREASQIPMIPAGAQQKMERLEATIRQQADRIAWLEGDVAGWRIKLAAAQEENRQLRDKLRYLDAPILDGTDPEERTVPP